MIKRVGYLITAGALLALGLAPTRALAASATLYLSPASGSVQNGNNLSVQIWENSGATSVNGVEADLTYPASLFSVSSISPSSAFGVVAKNQAGNGTISYQSGALPAVSGSQLVSTIIFTAKASSGSAAVNFANSSAVTANDGHGTNILSGTTGGNYTLTAPPASGGSGGSSSSSGSTSSSGGSSSSSSRSSSSKSSSATPTSAAKDTTPPAISDVKASAITATSVTVSWTTSEPSTSEVDYGTADSYGLTAVDGSLVTAHKLILNSALIEPATTYHFHVRSIDPSGNAASSNDSTFKTAGATLAVTVVGQTGKPVSGALVSFGGASAKTDKNGQATLSGLPLGRLAGTISYRGVKTPETFIIAKADLTKPKAIKFQIKVPASSSSWLVALIPLVIIVGLAATYFIRRGRPQNPAPLPPADISSQLATSLLPQPPTPPVAPGPPSPQAPATKPPTNTPSPTAPNLSEPVVPAPSTIIKPTVPPPPPPTDPNIP